MNKELLVQLTAIFLITQIVGLFAGNFLIEEQIKTTLINEDPEAVENSVALFVWIILFTIILLGVMKFASERIAYFLFKAFESMAIFGTTIIVLMPFLIADELILGTAFFIVLLRIIFRKNTLLKNVTSVIAAAGAGALIGASLGVLPIIIFLVLLSAYDFIAVFKTKHMVTLAKGITKKNLSFTYSLPTKEHNYELGTGDMVIPLAFATSVLEATKTTITGWEAFIPSIAILLSSLTGLIFTLHYASLKKGKPLPALPLQTVLMLIVYGIVVLAGFIQLGN